MKKIAINVITFYQRFVSPVLGQLLGIKNICRYEVTCSEYAKQQIEKEGIITGSMKALKRIASCQPFNKNYEYI